MLIGWAFGMYETFSIWRMLLMGAVFSGIMLGFSECRILKRSRISSDDRVTIGNDMDGYIGSYVTYIKAEPVK